MKKAMVDEAMVGAAMVDEAMVGTAMVGEAMVGGAMVDEAMVGTAMVDTAMVPRPTIASLTIALLTIVCSTIAPPALAQEETIGISVGSSVSAPIQVQDLEGNAVDLAAYIGKKPVLIEFWATWCALCKVLMPQFDAAKAKYGEGIEVLIVAVGVGQSRASVKRHAAEHAMPGRVFFDVSGAATRAFQAPSTSYIVGLDAKGTVRYTGLGDKQTVELVVRKAGGRTGG